MDRRKGRWGVLLLAAMLAGGATGSAHGQAPDKVRFGTNWVPEAEHGGFYQAAVDGTYARYGLDVTIVPGGPNTNNRLQLAVGKLDFIISGNSIATIEAVDQNVPTIAVASVFQKDPQVLLAHPDQGIQTFEALKKLTLFISSEGMAGFYRWMMKDFGFTEQQVKPYTFNPQPFLADKRSAMQGYVTSEPYAVETVGKISPRIFLLADHGFSSYSTHIETRRELVEKKPDMVQRFVDASIIGWYNYIYGDRSKADALIRKENPEMPQALLDHSVAKMKEYGIVDSGDTLTLGLGALTPERMKDFYDKMVSAGVVKAGLDVGKAYTTRFVNKKVGLELRPR